MYRSDTLKKDASARAAGFLNKIDKAIQSTKGFSELTAAIMDTATVVLEQAMKDAYFKGLRDAALVYEDKQDLQTLKDAVHKASEELNK